MVHYRALLRLIAYVGRTSDYVLRFTPEADRALEVFSDASWSEKNSTSGGLVMYLGCPVSWWTRRQKSVSTSTAEAEYFAASLASREALYLRDLLEADLLPAQRELHKLHFSERRLAPAEGARILLRGRAQQEARARAGGAVRTDLQGAGGVARRTAAAAERRCGMAVAYARWKKNLNQTNYV